MRPELISKDLEDEHFTHPQKVARGLKIALGIMRFHLRNRSFTITSDWRDDPKSSHYLGLAVDIAVTAGHRRHELVGAALKAGFKRIGIYDRHIHLDLDHTRPFPTIWTGESQ